MYIAQATHFQWNRWSLLEFLALKNHSNYHKIWTLHKDIMCCEFVKNIWMANAIAQKMSQIYLCVWMAAVRHDASIDTHITQVYTEHYLTMHYNEWSAIHQSKVLSECSSVFKWKNQPFEYVSNNRLATL